MPPSKRARGMDPAAVASWPISATLGTSATVPFASFVGVPAPPVDAVFLPIATYSLRGPALVGALASNASKTLRNREETAVQDTGIEDRPYLRQYDFVRGGWHEGLSMNSISYMPLLDFETMFSRPNRQNATKEERRFF